MAKDRRQKKKRNPGSGRKTSDRSEERHRLSSPAVGWDTYRGWLGQLSRHQTRRQGPESIYTWKGYQAWTAKVRADWEPES